MQRFFKRFGYILTAFQSTPKSMRVNINPLIKYCCPLTDPAAETKSTGLAADASGPAREHGNNLHLT